MATLVQLPQMLPPPMSPLSRKVSAGASVWSQFSDDDDVVEEPKRASASAVEGRVSEVLQRSKSILGVAHRVQADIMDVMDGNGIVADDEVSALNDNESLLDAVDEILARRNSESDAISWLTRMVYEGQRSVDDVLAKDALTYSGAMAARGKQRQKSALSTKRYAQSQVAAAVPEKAAPPKRVGWDQVIVREYGRTMGDNPSVSHGVPVGLTWKYHCFRPISLEDFEDMRCTFRRLHADFAWTGRLTAQERLEICINAGLSIEEMEDCLEEVVRLKRVQEENWRDFFEDEEDPDEEECTTPESVEPAEHLSDEASDSEPSVSSSIKSSVAGVGKVFGRVAAATKRFQRSIRHRSRKLLRSPTKRLTPIERRISTRTDRSSTVDSTTSTLTSISWAHDIGDSDSDDDEETEIRISEGSLSLCLVPADPRESRACAAPRRSGKGMDRFLDDKPRSPTASSEAETLPPSPPAADCSASPSPTTQRSPSPRAGESGSDDECVIAFTDIGMAGSDSLGVDEYAPSSPAPIERRTSGFGRLAGAIKRASPVKLRRKRSVNEKSGAPQGARRPPSIRSVASESDGRQSLSSDGSCTDSATFDNPMLTKDGEAITNVDAVYPNRDQDSRSRSNSKTSRTPPPVNVDLVDVPRESRDSLRPSSIVEKEKAFLTK